MAVRAAENNPSFKQKLCKHFCDKMVKGVAKAFGVLTAITSKSSMDRDGGCHPIRTCLTTPQGA